MMMMNADNKYNNDHNKGNKQNKIATDFIFCRNRSNVIDHTKNILSTAAARRRRRHTMGEGSCKNVYVARRFISARVKVANIK